MGGDPVLIHRDQVLFAVGFTFADNIVFRGLMCPLCRRGVFTLNGKVSESFVRMLRVIDCWFRDGLDSLRYWLRNPTFRQCLLHPLVVFRQRIKFFLAEFAGVDDFFFQLAVYEFELSLCLLFRDTMALLQRGALWGHRTRSSGLFRNGRRFTGLGSLWRLFGPFHRQLTLLRRRLNVYTLRRRLFFREFE